MRLLLDTHIWLWSLAAPDNLTRKVQEPTCSRRRAASGCRRSASGSCSFSPSAAGCGSTPTPGSGSARHLEQAPLEEAVLNHEVALRSREVALPHQDPADRFLVATALVYDLTLVTADDTLIDAKACPILANR